jgi:DNA (cytosine-5)-methyltransferase 1
VKILNLYAGIGGNRKLWGDEHDITAVENVQHIADVYQELFPNDTVVVGDAHQYLLDHYREFDFIWSSPPCPTHSRMNRVNEGMGRQIKYPDMALYQEIILLQHHFKGRFAVENVIPYYKPLIRPTIELLRHYFWTNFFVTRKYIDKGYKGWHNHGVTNLSREQLAAAYKIDLPDGTVDARKLLRNAVIPELGLHVFNCRDALKQEVML